MNTDKGRLRRLVLRLLQSRRSATILDASAGVVRSAHTVCFLGAIFGAASISNAQVPEVLFALDSPAGGARLLELDAQTGVVTRQVPYVNWIGSETALAYDGWRIIIRGNTNWNADRLIRAHPGDGAAIHLVAMGAPFRLIADDFNPVSGEVHGVCGNVQAGGIYCCRFDAATGVATIGAQIMSVTGVTAMAVDSAGNTFVCTAGGGPKLYMLDMNTGATTFVGDLAVPTTLAQDLAFNRAGQLWASLQDIYTGADTGLYMVDPITYAATRVVATPTLYFGIAFAQKTTSLNYCVAKVTSSGCVPSLSADGFASPTANLGFMISATDLNNNRPGLLLYGVGGQASLPFQGGLLCLGAPISRSPAASTAGTPAPVLDCSGAWSIDYNTMVWNKFHANTPAADSVNPSPLLTPGSTVQCQWWGRDPGFAPPNNSMLSDGLEFMLSP